MKEQIYKIGEVSEMLSIEQHTLRYLENSLKIKIKRDERGDRLYTDSDIDTLRLVLKLREKGLNTTAIRLALENTEEETQPPPTETVSPGPLVTFEFVEAVSLVRQVSEQNDEIIRQNRLLEERLKRLEEKLDRYSRERDQNLDELMQILKGDGNEGKNKSWLSRLRGK
ncbi:MAG: MerR family transcriptional regulator [Syntrophomonadaceae bacterium]|jgi:DNA-binding transcriptional MerR regulator|nr:MerR family transcriptional regulator [Bacillota bacterium]NLP23922.1 MerR family transcriptional regulator [Syntrophomonadaceae bacterium]